MAKPNRYKEMERKMTTALISDAALFLLYLVFAGSSVVWGKVICAVATLLISLACLALLYLSQELLKRRSLWLSTGFFSILVCVLASLILAFP